MSSKNDEYVGLQLKLSVNTINWILTKISFIIVSYFVQELVCSSYLVHYVNL